MPRAQASLVSYIPWFDRATAGMAGDNIHVLNPGSVIAHVTVGLPGATPDSFALGPGSATYVSFPAGTIGGPGTVTPAPPRLAGERGQDHQSFNEVPAAAPPQAKVVSHVMWFDKVTAGMIADNIHVLNTGSASANVTVSLPGASDIVFALAAGQETYVTFPFGKIGGPVTITATQNVLAAQRVQYYQTFNEVAAT